MKTFIKVSITALLLTGIIGFTAVSKQQADPGSGNPGDEPEVVGDTKL